MTFKMTLEGSFFLSPDTLIQIMNSRSFRLSIQTEIIQMILLNDFLNKKSLHGIETTSHNLLSLI